MSYPQRQNLLHVLPGRGTTGSRREEPYVRLSRKNRGAQWEEGQGEPTVQETGAVTGHPNVRTWARARGRDGSGGNRGRSARGGGRQEGCHRQEVRA